MKMPHEFEVRKEVTLDATPDEVWDLIATGPGIDTWFMGHNEVEPREGGVASIDRLRTGRVGRPPGPPAQCRR